MDSIIVSVTTECYLTIIYMRQVRVMASDGSATAGSETKVWIRRCQAPDMILNTYTLYPIRQEKKYGDTLDRIINQEYCHSIFIGLIIK